MSSGETDQWYVAVDEVTAGPAPTELVIRGIEHRKIPPEAQVCRAGTRRWSPLSTVDAFHAAVVRSYPPPPPDSEEARLWMAHGFHFAPLGALPSFDYPLEERPEQTSRVLPAPPPARAPIVAESLRDCEAELDAEWDAADAQDPQDVTDAEELDPDALIAADPETDAAIDWRQPFKPFFLVDGTVELPDESRVVASLASASRETFQDESALWNLALCLAYGSEAIATAAARTFFDAVTQEKAHEKGADRIDWMLRALLGNGFIHSGIPREAGTRGVQRLHSSCPPALSCRLS